MYDLTLTRKLIHKATNDYGHMVKGIWEYDLKHNDKTYKFYAEIDKSTAELSRQFGDNLSKMLENTPTSSAIAISGG